MNQTLWLTHCAMGYLFPLKCCKCWFTILNKKVEIKPKSFIFIKNLFAQAQYNIHFTINLSSCLLFLTQNFYSNLLLKLQCHHLYKVHRLQYEFQYHEILRALLYNRLEYINLTREYEKEKEMKIKFFFHINIVR